MKTQINILEDKIIVKVIGRLDCNAANELCETLSAYYNETSNITLDFAELTYISESGLRLLLSSYEVMWANGGKFRVVNCVPSIEERLRLTGLSEYLSFEEDEKIDCLQYDYEALRQEAERRLSESRYQHCLRVSENARVIAERFGLDIEKAHVSGLLHDIAKELPNEKFLEIAEANNIRISGSERKAPHKLHGKVGAIVAREELGIEDYEILSGISHHFGYTEMTDFEESIFLADIFDKTVKLGYEPSMDELLARDNLDEAIIYMLGFVLNYQIDKEVNIGAEVSMIYDYVIDKKMHGGKHYDEFQEFIKNRPTIYGDELFDKIFDTYTAHSLVIDGVKNMRELGGHHTCDGGFVKKNMLIRSGALNNLSREDAEELRKMGISHIIDFRGEHDRIAMPDANVDGFTNVVCELKSIKIRDYQKKLVSESEGLDHDRYFGYLWMNSEFLRGVDIEQMYKDCFQLDESIQHLRDMLNILVSDECTGAVIHCRDGKDRTGVAANIILMALGVCDEEIMLDYMATIVPDYATIEIVNDYFTFYEYDEAIIRNSRREKNVDYELVRSVQNWFVKEFGNMENYFHNILKLDDDFIRRFRDKYLCQ